MYFLIAVLATIVGDTQNVSVLEGERAKFACEFRKGNESDIDINWRVGDNLLCKDDMAPDGIGCSTNDTHSVLVINTLAPGSYPVQCILEQNIPSDFRNGPSFQENFNSISSSFSLTIEPKSKLFRYSPNNWLDK